MFIIPNAKPWITDLEAYYVDNAIRTGWLTSKGKYHQQLEEELANYLDVKYVALVSNGSVACYILMEYIKQRERYHPSSCISICIPDLTYVATLNAVVLAGLNPVLVDVKKDTWNIDPTLLAHQNYAFPVDLYGNPCNAQSIMDYVYPSNVFFDSAECFAGGYEINAEEKMVGSVGAAASFSGYANKTITLGGEGGWISTNDGELYRFIKDFSCHCTNPNIQYQHHDVGWNFRLTNLQAAFGLAQLHRLSDIQTEKERVFSRYLSGFANTHIKSQQLESMGNYHSKWVFACLVKNRKKVQQALTENDIEYRTFFKPLHTLEFARGYQFITRQHTPFLSVSQQLYDGGIVLPSYPELLNSQIDKIVGVVLGADK